MNIKYLKLNTTQICLVFTLKESHIFRCLVIPSPTIISHLEIKQVLDIIFASILKQTDR